MKERLRLKPGIELGILLDALLIAHRDMDKKHHIPTIKNKIAQRLQDKGLSEEEVESFLRTIERWIHAILER